MSRNRVVLVVALAATLGLSGAACGDDDDDGETDAPDATDEATEELSAAEWAEEASAICTAADEDVQAASQAADIQGPTDFPAIVEAATEATAIGEEALTQLEELEAPSEIEGDVDVFLTQFQANTVTLGEVADAAEAQDSGALEDLDAELDNIASAFGDAANELGVTCGVVTE